MKLTERPWATVSTSISLNAAIVSGEAVSGAILIDGIVLTPRQRNDINAGRRALIGKRRFHRRAETEAVTDAEFMPFAGFDDDQLARQHPEGLADVGVG